MNRQKTSFEQRVTACALALFHVRLRVTTGTTEQQVRLEHQTFSSPRFGRAVAQKLRDLECRAYLDSIDALAWLECRQANGRRNLFKFTARRVELFQHPLAWIVGELRDQRLEEFARREQLDLDVALRKQGADRKEATLPQDRVLVYSAPKAPRHRHSDMALKHMQEALSGPMKLRRARTRHHLDEMISKAYMDAPWMREVLTWVWQHNIARLEAERPCLEIPPLLLVGPPGTGKTHFAAALCKTLGLASARIDMSTRSATFDLSGSEYTWTSATPGIPVRTMAGSGTANPVMVLDELEKAGPGSNGGKPLDALLPLLQRETARTFQCPYLQTEVDLSWCGWIATANDISRLPAPLLDRFHVFHVHPPEGKDLLHLVRRTLTPAGAAPEIVDEACHQIQLGRMSLRGLDRLAHDLRRLQDRPLLQ